MSHSTIRRSLHKCKHREFISRYKTLVTLKNPKGRLDLARKPAQFWNKIFGQMNLALNYTRIMRKEGYGEARSKTYRIVCQIWWAWACAAAHGSGSLVFIDDVTAEGSSRMNFEVYRVIYFLLSFSHILQNSQHRRIMTQNIP